jgi:phospholipase A1
MSNARGKGNRGGWTWAAKKMKITGILFFSLFACNALHAQIKEVEEMWRNQVDTSRTDPRRLFHLEVNDFDNILKWIDRQPSFGMYKDNYIITGVPLNRAINKYTADIKFQLSVRQRLTKTVLPYNTFLMLTYTQKSFWDVYAKSSPFRDNNYNPGISLIKHVIYKKQLRGTAIVAFEHESNGRDSLDSRGWNYFVLSGVYFFNACFSAQAKIWAGWLDKGDDDLEGSGNPDLYRYRGYGLVALNYRSLNDKFWASAVINPRTKFGRFNTQVELNFRRSPKSNQYFFIQWYNGYGESLLEYNQYTSMLRVGICIKPPLRNLY